jgi:DNA-binding transcriptional LysR family regulator
MELNIRGFTGKINDNDLRLLRIFMTIVRNGSFVAAESELQIGLPSISRYVKDLEIRTGVRLCERGRRGFSVTPEGMLVFEASQRLFEDLGNFEEMLRGIPADPGGVIRIGTCSTLAAPRERMPDILDAYKRAFPNVQVDMTTKTSNLVEQDVIDGKLDLGIIFVRRMMDQLVYRDLLTEVSNIYCSIRHPLWQEKGDNIALTDLETVNYAGYPFARGMKKMGVDGILSRTAVGDTLDLIATMVASGHYVGFLPDRFVETAPIGRDLRRILPEVFSYDVDIAVIHRSGNNSRMVNGFLASMFSEAEKDKAVLTTH